MAATQKNWAGNFTYSAGEIHVPAALDDVRRLVATRRHIRALGSRHSFNDIGDSREDLVSLERLDRIVHLDPDRGTVTIEGGVRYGQLGRFLHEHGYALPNLASLPHISVAGACATATHGSGERNGNLATSVAAMSILSPDGDVIEVSRDADGADFDGMVVSLGALGIVVGMVLNVVPTFDVRQDVYEDLPLDAACDSFDAIQASAYSVSLFTRWDRRRFEQVWLKQAGASATPGDTFYGAARAARAWHPIPGVSAESCTEQLGVIGPWQDRLPHFRMDFTPSSGEELQSEYFVPRTHAASALRAVMRMGDRIAPLLLVSEVRTIAADHLWLSPCYGQSMMALHFTWKPDWPAVRAFLPELEAALAPFDARPHWGKLFTMSASRIQALFDRLPDFRSLLVKHDPGGKFRNDFVNTFIMHA